MICALGSRKGDGEEGTEGHKSNERSCANHPGHGSRYEDMRRQMKKFRL